VRASQQPDGRAAAGPQGCALVSEGGVRQLIASSLGLGACCPQTPGERRVKYCVFAFLSRIRELQKGTPEHI